MGLGFESGMGVMVVDEEEEFVKGSRLRRANRVTRHVESSNFSELSI